MQAETPLERMVRDAWHEPGLRPTFYRRLLDSDVLVPVQPCPEHVATGVIGAGARLNVITLVRQTDRVGVIPFFTSPERVFEGYPAGERCVQMRVRELFEARRDMHFHLNPFSKYGREFFPHEVSWLLSSGGIAPLEQIELEGTEALSLRTPRQITEPVVSALRVLYARNFDVLAAYFAECTDAASGVKFLVLLDMKEAGDAALVLQDTGTVVNEVVGAGSSRFAVALLPRDGSAPSPILDDATPFYRMGLTGSIASAARLQQMR